METRAFPSGRREQIDFVLSELSRLQPQSDKERYSIEQNRSFFEALKSRWSYFRWLYKVRKKIRAVNLLEINELLPDLDEVFHEKMAEVERQPSPGIIRPLVDAVSIMVTEASQERRFRIASLGSGSMEVERQIIEQIQNRKNPRPVTVAGFDVSPRTRVFAARNLAGLTQAKIVQVSGLTEEKLEALERETQELVLIVISDNDIFTLKSTFTPNAFDLIMTALFLHHLDEDARVRIVEDMRTLAPQTFNYDGYKNEIVVPMLSVTGWRSPVFLNAAIFSTIRFPNREEALKLHAGAKIDFYKHGHYRATFSS